MERKSFLDLPAPANYVAGVGRGATGFTTRSDIGPGRSGFVTRNGGGSDNEDDEDENRDSAQLEQSEQGLLTNGGVNEDDQEADRVYEEIEQRLRSKRKHVEDDESSNKKKRQEVYKSISSQFSDLKKGLSSISADQWMNLPEAGDMTKRNKRERELSQQQRRTYNAGDSLIAGLRASGATDNHETILDNDTDFGMISSARGKMLSSKLDGYTDVIESFDSKNYLDKLQIEQEKIQELNEDVGDLTKSRAIFKSLRTTEPYNPINWISSARIEVKARKFDLAKKIIVEGCHKCANDQEIWLESINIHSSDVVSCRKIVAEALTFNLKSEKLWLKAIQLENDVFSKKKIVQKALKNSPNSVDLWKTAISLEDSKEEAKKLLNAAVEIIPEAIELWLVLINLESDVKQSRKILNDARKSLPKSHEIWVEACKLEERNGAESSKIEKLMSKGVATVISHGNTIKRNAWFEIAKNCEDSNFPLTAVSIIRNTISLGFEDTDEVDKLILWQEYAEKMIKSQHLVTAKAIYGCTLEKHPEEIPIWRAYFGFLKKHGTVAQLYDAFDQAIKANSSCEEFRLRYAKEKWINNDVESARAILNDSFEKDPTNSEIWLAAVKLETSTKNYEKALLLFQQAREKLPQNPRILYKWVTLYRQLSRDDDALNLVEESLLTFPEIDKFHIQKGQILGNLKDFSAAREAYATGVRVCENSIPLWCLLVRSFSEENMIIRARSILDRAIVKNPDSDELWVVRIELERVHKTNKEVEAIINEASKKFPKSAKIWAQRLQAITKRSEMKKHLLVAMKETNSDSQILLAVGINFFVDGKFDKAKVWFERAVGANKDFGDAWCWLYLFLKKRGSPEEVEQLLKDASVAEPRHGKVWPSINKDVKNFDKSMKELFEIASEKLLK
ncbi:U4/U6-U5 snRNP complex subunit [Saccharomycopsis crataegensis]|uniref:U4/U6-U5 snRNP complex subunit n=1 Tax=Saccharomycopsis crataegensis TaxID=43959 RepID=A0AAV5QTF0_9ASCO|nr:U4/U6-U5 snRNP complex subunit [Saccharomycopsis crataegensis]